LYIDMWLCCSKWLICQKKRCCYFCNQSICGPVSLCTYLLRLVLPSSTEWKYVGSLSFMKQRVHYFVSTNPTLYPSLSYMEQFSGWLDTAVMLGRFLVWILAGVLVILSVWGRGFPVVPIIFQDSSWAWWL
jgi:hypothetical protein